MGSREPIFFAFNRGRANISPWRQAACRRFFYRSNWTIHPSNWTNRRPSDDIYVSDVICNHCHLQQHSFRLTSKLS